MKKIELTHGKVALVDDADFDLLNKHKWFYHHHGYAMRRNGKKMCFMHRVIMDTPKGMYTDHIDHDKLNNQRCNLRICTLSENNRNAKKKKNGTSKYMGVCLVKAATNLYYYRTTIAVNGKSITKSFPSTPEGEMQAALCYNKMAKKYFGEFAIQNELPSSLQLTDPPKYIQNKVLEWLEINGHTDVSVNKIAESLSINPNSIYLPIRYLERKNKIKITSRYPTRVIINVEANG
jgi:hypothetical protein